MLLYCGISIINMIFTPHKRKKKEKKSDLVALKTINRRERNVNVTCKSKSHCGKSGGKFEIQLKCVSYSKMDN